MQQQVKFWISLFVTLVLVLHVVPVMQRLQDKRQTWWPIMAWGMYKKSRPPQPISTLQKRLIAVDAKGKEQEIRHWHSGYSWFAFERIFMKPMWEGEAEPARQLAEKINRHLEIPIVAFRLESVLYTLTDNGITKQENPDVFFDALN